MSNKKGKDTPSNFCSIINLLRVLLRNFSGGFVAWLPSWRLDLRRTFPFHDDDRGTNLTIFYLHSSCRRNFRHDRSDSQSPNHDTWTESCYCRLVPAFESRTWTKRSDSGMTFFASSQMRSPILLALNQSRLLNPHVDLWLTPTHR